jgi:hypothetical protein
VALDIGPIPDDIAGKVIEFDIKTPVDEAGLRANIAHALSLGLPEANLDVPVLRIVATGPSAHGAPLDGPTLALNGALKNVFLPQHRAPTFWAACDPQELVCDFLDCDLPRDTTYLVASKCHPSVFERLRGFDVRVWHVDDYVQDRRAVPCGTTITTVAPALMLQRGFPRFEVWGWDACFGSDGDHHVGSQPFNYPEKLRLEVDGRMFDTTRSWALEAIDAANSILPVYRYLGIEIVIKGDGMIRALEAGSVAVFHPPKGPIPCLDSILTG